MALIFNEQGQVLVTRRKFDPGKGSLDFPGGFAEPGEGIEDCLVREVKEELDLTVTNLTYLASFANTYPYESIVYPVTDMAFVCQVKSLNPLAPGDDVAGVFFAALADLDPSQFAMASAAKVVKQIQSRAPVRLPGPNPLG